MIIHNAAFAASVLGECDGRGEARIRAREWAVLCVSPALVPLRVRTIDEQVTHSLILSVSNQCNRCIQTVLKSYIIHH